MWAMRMWRWMCRVTKMDRIRNEIIRKKTKELETNRGKYSTKYQKTD